MAAAPTTTGFLSKLALPAAGGLAAIVIAMLGSYLHDIKEGVDDIEKRYQDDFRKIGERLTDDSRRITDALHAIENRQTEFTATIKTKMESLDASARQKQR